MHFNKLQKAGNSWKVSNQQSWTQTDSYAEPCCERHTFPSAELPRASVHLLCSTMTCPTRTHETLSLCFHRRSIQSITDLNKASQMSRSCLIVCLCQVYNMPPSKAAAIQTPVLALLFMRLQALHLLLPKKNKTQPCNLTAATTVMHTICENVNFVPFSN